LRRTSLDELPQLINVLKGDMSLVGPRPLIENEDRQVEGRFRQRLASSPGLTGPWQIHGRSEIPFEEMINLDYLYVMNWSLWGDVKLMLRTVHAIVRGQGAY
jgi:lipopolysaccharide/colanic/teichoic acid biosynthesis glycosyltransferase